MKTSILPKLIPTLHRPGQPERAAQDAKAGRSNEHSVLGISTGRLSICAS
jgi:hypothetical protein